MKVDGSAKPDFGELRATFRAGLDLWVNLAFMLAVLLAAFVSFYVEFPGQPLWSLIATVIALVIVADVVSRLWIRVETYERGLIYRFKQKRYAWRWHEISAVWRKSKRRYYKRLIPVGSVHVFTLATPDGTFILGGAIHRIGELGDIIESETLACRLPHAKESFRRGGTLTFGPLAISKAGIAHGRTSYRGPKFRALTSMSLEAHAC